MTMSQWKTICLWDSSEKVKEETKNWGNFSPGITTFTVWSTSLYGFRYKGKQLKFKSNFPKKKRKWVQMKKQNVSYFLVTSET